MSVRFECSSDHDTHIGGANLFKCGRAACSLASRVILDPDIRRAVKMAPALVANSMRIRIQKRIPFFCRLYEPVRAIC
eukprot:13068-Heterococcus_DN1.PRE.3